jgi:chromosome segregation ATPase
VKATVGMHKVGGRYSLEEKQILVDQWIKIQPESARQGWTRLNAQYDKATNTSNRSQSALMKAFEGIQNSTDDELAPLHKKIEQKEANEFQKKHILTSVAGHVGSIYPSNDREGDKTKGDKADGQDGKENDDPNALKNRVKRQMRLDAFKKSRAEQEKRKEGLLNMSESLNRAIETLVINRQGIHTEIANLKVEIASLKTEQKEMGKNLKEIHNALSKIVELMEKKGDGEKK